MDADTNLVLVQDQEIQRHQTAQRVRKRGGQRAAIQLKAIETVTHAVYTCAMKI